ncbi:MAG: phosphate/phosphite/phosphonate ABC transporter substrate-binding protein [Anaerolineales bacterium]
MFRWRLWLLLPIFLMACGSVSTEDSTQAPTARPTLTATPRSTELPPVPTPIPLGSAERPIQLAFLAEDTPSNRQAAQDFAEALQTELATFRLGLYEGLVVEIAFLDSAEAALDALCNARDTAVFADSLTFAAAARNCDAVPRLQTLREGERGVAFEIIVNRSILVNITQLRGRAFCAVAVDDPFSFVYPTLALRANGVDPLADFTDIFTGFEDQTEMLLAVSGRYEPGRIPLCAGTAMPLADFNRILDDLREDTERGLTEAQANQLILPTLADDDSLWTPIPYEILVFPPAGRFAEALREAVVAALLDLQSDAGSAQADLQTLLPHDELEAVNAADYADFLGWLERAGWDMASATN